MIRIKVILDKRSAWCWSAGGVASALLLFLLLLTACSQQEAPDPLLRYAPAMRPEFQTQLSDLTQLPRYDISVNLSVISETLTGEMQVHVVNTSSDPWPVLVFRLYPMISQYNGGLQNVMLIHRAAINGKTINVSYIANNTAVELLLPEPLRPNEAVDVQLRWAIDIPLWPDNSGGYVLFGKSQQMISLPLFYPSLAVYQPLRGIEAGRWWQEIGTVRGDTAFNVASLFVVTATMPADQMPVASGTLITSTLINAQEARHVWVTGPSREFLLHLSSRFGFAHTEAYGTRITSYWLPGQEAMGRAALNYAVAALRIFSDLFGPYPFRDMRVAPAPLNYRGMEYPQVSLIGVELYDRYRDSLEILVVHEVAHQWWYQLVHNDPISEPWLDEALAEYSVKLYLEQVYGGAAASTMQEKRWQLPITTIKGQGGDRPVDQAVGEFASAPQYETIIYGKGALFYDALREALGERRFNRFLQDYLRDHEYQIVTTEDWLAAIRQLNTPEIEVLYDTWVKRPPLLPPATATPIPQANTP
ncbi:MAG: M1 family metallopeptidase [Caldilineaceae bacterium]|nr:M1 family metallopeptidase [Caldilineaceae bacterium]